MNLNIPSLGRRRRAFVVALVAILYVVIQSFAINAVASPADDVQELAYINGMANWTQLFGKDVFGLFRPMKNLLFLLLSCFDPSDVSGFRLICVGIGILSFFPVLSFCRKVFANDCLAIIAASVWFLSPTLVSSTAWLSCVNIQIMAMLAALAVCQHDDGSTVGAAACLVVACLSYESAVAIGPVIVAYDYFLRPDRFRTPRAWKRYAAYVVVTVLYLFVRWLVGSASSVNGSLAGVSRAELMCSSAYFTLQHFGIWLWPFGNMAVFGGYSAGQVSALGHLFCWAVVAALAASALILRGRAPRFCFGISMAFLAFLPTSNILGIGNGPYGDYYMDVASIGLSIAVVSVVAWFLSSSRRFAKVFIALAAVILLSRVCAVAESARWAYLWADGGRAYKSTLATFPKSYYGYVVYAQWLCNRDDYSGALACCDDAERLIGNDNEKLRYVDMVRAICAMRGEKNAAKALGLIEKCQKDCSSPSIVRLCRFYRGCVAEDLMNDLVFAQHEYEAAMPAVMGVDDIRTADRLARLYAVKGDVQKAIDLWSLALRVSPGDFSIMWNLAIALRGIGMKEEAERLQMRAREAVGGR